LNVVLEYDEIGYGYETFKYETILCYKTFFDSIAQCSWILKCFSTLHESDDLPMGRTDLLH